MKRLIVVRHAKSSWSDTQLDDHDRPLNNRGERDAPFMAKILKEKKIDVDLIASSTAKRALTTAKKFAKKLGYRKRKIHRTIDLYLAELSELIGYVQSTDERKNTLVIFCHNPGITHLVNYFSDASIDNIPTCGVCSIQFQTKSWKDLSEGKGKLEFFEYPKKYFPDSAD